MGGFSLKLVEVCQGLKLKKDSRVFVVRKFSGKRMGFSLSHWSTAGQRFPVVGSRVLVVLLTVYLVTCAGSEFQLQS